METTTEEATEAWDELQQMVKRVCGDGSQTEEDTAKEDNGGDSARSWLDNEDDDGSGGATSRHDDEYNDHDDDDDDEEEGVIAQAQTLLVGKSTSDQAAVIEEVEQLFHTCHDDIQKREEDSEFECIEEFVLSEQGLGRARRSAARLVSANEEQRLAAEIAELKGLRFKAVGREAQQELRNQVEHAERAYTNRRMVFAKAAQTAAAEARLQFARTQQFFEELHTKRLRALRRQYDRTLQLQSISHRLRGTDARVVALQRQVESRLYHKKRRDANELYMKQNAMEAAYLESMLGLLDKVQAGKENAARELLKLNVEFVKEQRKADDKRAEELELLRASATRETTEMLAYFLEEQSQVGEDEHQKEERVQATERRNRRIRDPSNHEGRSVSQLYELVIWSVANEKMDWGSSDLGMYSSVDWESELGDIDEGEPRVCVQFGSCSGSTTSSTGTDGSEDWRSQLSPIGDMQLKKLTESLRTKERSLIEQHKAAKKKEQRAYRHAVHELKKTHQVTIVHLLDTSLQERQKMRSKISCTMGELSKEHVKTTQQLRDDIEKDLQVMREALRAEDTRLAEAEKNSFIKAQALISAQTFHEVRNALSSVIAMAEMTSELKNDTSVDPGELISSVDNMLDQSKDVVRYSLLALNNVLDVTKLQSETFKAMKTPFDINELVACTTRMQLAKAVHAKMDFVPYSQTSIALSDPDIVERLIANMISNSVKFTSAGAIQPFVWPLEDLILDDESVGGETTDISVEKLLGEDRDEGLMRAVGNERLKIMAVGVADTGRGLSQIELDQGKDGASFDSDTSREGVRNTGFGLYFGHLLTKAIGSKLHLSRLQHCQKLLNKDMIRALDEHNGQWGVQEEKTGINGESIGRPSEMGTIPGPGTVLFFCVPVFEDGPAAQKLLQGPLAHSLSPDIPINSHKTTLIQERDYVFRPLPSAAKGSFRVLVADDVLLLRKGLANMIAHTVQGCPVTICSASSAEDLLRAVASQPFDLIVSDHIFDQGMASNTTPRKLDKLAPRPQLLVDMKRMSKSELRGKLADFFKSERFTVDDGDEALTGFEAFMRMARESDPPFPKPLLILVSGHKLVAPPGSGILVSQKPLHQSEFVRLLEQHAPHLVEAGVCVRGDTINVDGSVSLLNRHGSQIFVCHAESENFN